MEGSFAGDSEYKSARSPRQAEGDDAGQCRFDYLQRPKTSEPEEKTFGQVRQIEESRGEENRTMDFFQTGFERAPAKRTMQVRERTCRTPQSAGRDAGGAGQKLMGGEITEQVSDMEQEAEEFEAWLKEKTTDSKEKTEAMDSGAETKAVAMDAALRATQDNQRMLAQQLHEMQTQMTYVAQLMTMPKTPMPATGGVRSPTQVATTPDSGTKRKSALEPFSRAHRAEPYGRHPPPQETTKDGLETLDGT